MAKLNWTEIIQQAVPVIRSFLDRDITPNLRTLYYALVARHIIPNTRSAYQTLSRKVVQARKDGIIRWHWIADETRSTSGSDNPFWKPERYAKRYTEYVFEKLMEFKLPRWLDQHYYVEVWIEKNALRETFNTWLSSRNVTIVPCRGYSSWTFLKSSADRIGSRSGDKDAIILYFGDFDPSGKDIDRFIEETMDWFGVSVTFERICITLDQIEEHNLPSAPESAKEIEKLKRDPRYKKWEHGLFVVELDALMAYVPDTFQEIVQDAVDEYFDDDIHEKVLERQKEEQKIVLEKAQEHVEKGVKELKEALEAAEEEDEDE